MSWGIPLCKKCFCVRAANLRTTMLMMILWKWIGFVLQFEWEIQFKVNKIMKFLSFLAVDFEQNLREMCGFCIRWLQNFVGEWRCWHWENHIHSWPSRTILKRRLSSHQFNFGMRHERRAGWFYGDRNVRKNKKYRWVIHLERKQKAGLTEQKANFLC